MDLLFQAIEDSKQQLLGRLETIEKTMTRLDVSMSTLAEQYNEIQQRVSKTEDDLNDAQVRIKTLEKTTALLQSKVDYLENQSRQSNLLIVGVPEGVEGTDCTAFVRGFIPELLGTDHFAEPLRVERSHRLGARREAAAATRPRPLIMKLLNYQDKVKILQVAREKKDLLFQRRRIFFFPDFSPAVQAQRKTFIPVKKKLQALGLRYALLFPAVLSLTYQGKYRRFHSPEEVEQFIASQDSLISQPASPMSN